MLYSGTVICGELVGEWKLPSCTGFELAFQREWYDYGVEV